MLALLEKTEAASTRRTAALDELPLFAAARSAAAPRPPAPRRSSGARRMKPDELSPRAALEALYRLKALRQGGSEPER